MPVKYEAVALKKCQFQGVLYPPGRRYSGFRQPPEGLFRVISSEDLSEETIAEQKAAEEKAKKERVPSDPTPRDREEEQASLSSEQASLSSPPVRQAGDEQKGAKERVSDDKAGSRKQGADAAGRSDGQ